MVAAMLACLVAAAALAADDLDLSEQEAIRAAVDRVEPAVVRIETVGGLERVGGVLFGTGPTTGLVVHKDGYLISSAFSFANLPSSILVRLPDGTRKPAKLVATDHARMIVLLKIETDKPLAVPEVVPAAEMRVGQWALAVGRTFESDRPNVAAGVISALGRIWGKAIQTDAAVSPNNYGGPLVDIRGRVLGVLVPLSPQSDKEVAGVEWYDSGIGFAIDAEHIQKILPRLMKGEDLRPGVIGITLKGHNPSLGEPVVSGCRPNSPAAEAGIKAGDRIAEIDGVAITRAAGIKEELGRRYAGDKVKIALVRDGKRIECNVELVAELQPYEHPFLGVLPMRTPAGDAGVTVRYVYPDSAAARAKIEPGDVIVSVAGEAVGGRNELLARTSEFEPDEEIELEVRHGQQTDKRKLKLGRLPEELPPAKLPSARGDVEPADKRPQVGTVELKVPEFKNDVWAYVPEGYDPGVPHGVVVWLHAPGGFEPKDLLARWKPLCDAHDLILVAPKAAHPERWSPGEVTLVEKLLGQVSATYTVDSTRVVVHGHEGGGTLAALVAAQHRTLIRALAVVEAPLAAPLPDTEAAYRLAVYVASAKKSSHAKAIKDAVKRVRQMKIPLTVKDLGDDPRYLNAEELAELARWIDMLDRI